MRRLLLAGCILALLALGPFASPLVADEVLAQASSVPQPVDHRNDLPVVQPDRPPVARGAIRPTTTRLLVAAVLVTGLGLAALARPTRRDRDAADPALRVAWSEPPHRGPPRLLAR